MRVLGALVLLGLALVLTRWIRRRHEREGGRVDGVSGELSGSAGGQLSRPADGGRIAKAEGAQPGRLLTTRGIESVGAMAAFVMILLAMYLILRFIVAF